jgi:hypothetical protein
MNFMAFMVKISCFKIKTEETRINHEEHEGHEGKSLKKRRIKSSDCG